MRHASIFLATLLLAASVMAMLLTVTHAARPGLRGALNTAASSSSSQVDPALVDMAASLLSRVVVPGHAWRSALEPNLRDGQHGGTHCATCVILVNLLEQYAVVKQQSIEQVVNEICSLFPATLQEPCKYAVDTYGPTLVAALERAETPEKACVLTTLCTDAVCVLHDGAKAKAKAAVARQQASSPTPVATSPTYTTRLLQQIDAEAAKVDLTPWQWFKEQINKVFNTHLPLVDFDNDYFSGNDDTFRGFMWRGRDCQDFDKNIYPGRKTPSTNPRVDHDCNGISGVDPQGRAYEDTLCGPSVQSRGVIVLGDSAAAHFHIPPQWMTPTQWSSQIFEHAMFALSDELDWPELSAYTGFTNFSYGLTPGPMESIYTQMLDRNRCIHRDFQNIGVNGARVGAIADGISQSMARDQANDRPALLFHALIGNDVCNGHPDTFNHMTTPAEFEASVLKTLDYLDTKLPAGSSVVFIGLVDGRILFDTMHNLTHPIGATYAEVYDYLNCLEISPCRGWLNTNSTIREMTTDVANSLNAVYSKIMSQHAYKNFNMALYSFGDLIEEAIQEWTATGGKVSDLIEPIDGFHPSQTGLWLTARVLFRHLLAEHPDMIGPVNPNNNTIKLLFGDQGGY